MRSKSWKLPDLNGPLLCTKNPGVPELQEKQDSDFLFVQNEILVFKPVYRSTDFEVEPTHQLVRLVTETSQVVLFLFHSAS